MDNLSSSDLDSPSKTPLFIAIAAILIGLAGLGLGWMGFSRANELEQRLSSLEAAGDSSAELAEAVDVNSDRLDRVVANMTSLSQSVSEALGEAGSDISRLKSDVRKVAIEAGTAKKMAEELERVGVRAASVPPPAQAERPSEGSQPASEGGNGESGKAPDASPGSTGVYTIKSGDTLGRIAAAYNITLSELQAANPGVDARRLRIGQQIVVPAAE